MKTAIRTLADGRRVERIVWASRTWQAVTWAPPKQRK